MILVGADVVDEKIELLLSQVGGKDLTELIATGREKFASVPCGGGIAVAVAAPAGGSGGGVAASAAAEPKKEEKVVEKEESDEVMFVMISLGSSFDRGFTNDYFSCLRF